MSLTDEPTANAITAVWHDDETTTEHWFSRISATYHEAVSENDGNPPEFDQFWPKFDAAASSDHSANVEAFHGYLTNVNDPMAVIADLAGDSPDAVLAEVVGMYLQGVAAAHAEAAETPAEEDGEPYDESYWAAYLQRWAGGWDGTEQGWPEFVEGFGHWAGEESKFGVQIKEQADALLTHAGTLVITERVAYLTDFGIVTVVELPIEETAPGALEAETGQAPAVEDDESTEDAPLAEQLAVTEAVTQTVDEMLEQDVMPALAATLKDFPEAAELTPEEINEVLEKVLADQLSKQLGTSA